jgi:hypothetical protein
MVAAIRYMAMSGKPSGSYLVHLRNEKCRLCFGLSHWYRHLVLRPMRRPAPRHVTKLSGVHRSSGFSALLVNAYDIPAADAAS